MIGLREIQVNLTHYYPISQGSSSAGLLDKAKICPMLGDLHGNALKLLCFLQIEGLITIDEKSYLAMVTLYNLSQADTFAARESAAQQFYADVLPNIKVVAGSQFRGLGDFLGDRGGNDLYTLEIMGALIDVAGFTDVEIILSNHDAYFIQWMEAKLKGEIVEPWRRVEGLAGSLKRLDELLKDEMVELTHLANLYQKYKYTFRLLSYTYNMEGKFVLASHAHLDERDVLKMANGFLENIDEISKSLSEANRVALAPVGKELTTLCDRLNKSNEMISVEDTKALVDWINMIVQLAAQSNSLTTLINLNKEHMTQKQGNGYGINPTVSPVYYALWNRDDIDARVQTRPKNPDIYNAHGHHTYPHPQNNAICLNNYLGQYDNKEGLLTSLRTVSAGNILSVDDAKRCNQIMHLLDKMVEMGNVTYKKAQLDSLIEFVPGKHDVVNQICGVLKTQLQNLSFKDNMHDKHVVKKVNEVWQAIDDIVAANSQPSNTQKIQRAVNDRLTTRFTQAKATTNETIQQWNEYKAKNNMTNASSVVQPPRPGGPSKIN